MNITNVEIGGLDWQDYPKFCDAYVEDCEIDAPNPDNSESFLTIVLGCCPIRFI